MAKYNEKNQVFPDRIIVYRDGVSDGQFDAVSQFEVPQIKKSFKYVSETYRYDDFSFDLFILIS